MTRLVAFLLAVGLVAPAVGECVGWSAIAAGRHACCARSDTAPSRSTLTSCCAMSTGSPADVVPPESPPARTAMKLLAAPVPPAGLSAAPARTSLPIDPRTSTRAPVPIYLQQAALLI